MPHLAGERNGQLFWLKVCDFICGGVN
jgi:hypothetical protein